MADFILKYWLQTLFTAMVAAFTAGVACMSKRSRRSKDIEQAIMALLHDRLYQAGRYLLEQKGWASVEDRQNLEAMYTPYKKLGMNGTCEHMYLKISGLPYHENYHDTYNGTEGK